MLFFYLFEIIFKESIFKLKMVFITINLFIFVAHASLSASGSLASIIDEAFSSASFMLRSSALFPSSGFGYFTVGNSGSGNFCSSTAKNG